MVDLVISADHATYAITEPKVGRGAPWASPLALDRRTADRRWSCCSPRSRSPRSACMTSDSSTASSPYDELLVRGRGDGASDCRQCAAVGPGRQEDGLPLGRPGLQEGYDRADELWEHVYLSEDGQEGPRAFREKRKPVWQGR